MLNGLALENENPQDINLLNSEGKGLRRSSLCNWSDKTSNKYTAECVVRVFDDIMFFASGGKVECVGDDTPCGRSERGPWAELPNFACWVSCIHTEFTMRLCARWLVVGCLPNPACALRFQPKITNAKLLIRCLEPPMTRTVNGLWKSDAPVFSKRNLCERKQYFVATVDFRRVSVCVENIHGPCQIECVFRSFNINSLYRLKMKCFQKWTVLFNVILKISELGIGEFSGQHVGSWSQTQWRNRSFQDRRHWPKQHR